MCETPRPTRARPPSRLSAQMVDAKHDAHAHYELIRSRLPELCKGTAVDAAKLEDFITGRLNTSALDGAVAALSMRADGLFLYAHLLASHLESAGESLDFKALDSLPAGLADVYEVNFRRAFPTAADWADALPLVELVAAAPEPLAVATARAMLGWDDARWSRALELTSLVLPVRDGAIHALHKTEFDWLTGEIDEASGVRSRSKEFGVDRAAGHERAAIACAAALAPESAADDAAAEALRSLAGGDAAGVAPRAHALRFIVHHLVRAAPRCAAAETAMLRASAFLRARVDAASARELTLALHNLGVACCDRREFGRAREAHAAAAAAALNPETAADESALAAAAALLDGRHDDVDARCREILGRHPDHGLALFAQAYSRSLRGENADELFERVMLSAVESGGATVALVAADGSDGAYLASVDAAEDATQDIATGQPARVTEKLAETPVVLKVRNDITPATRAREPPPPVVAQALSHFGIASASGLVVVEGGGASGKSWVLRAVAVRLARAQAGA